MFCSILWALFLPTISEGFSLGRNCGSPQYVSLGSRSTLMCNLGAFTAISWYKDAGNEFVIHCENGVRNGISYQRGIYDVSEGGGLIINNVSIEHETSYKVVTYTADTHKQIFTVEVKLLEQEKTWTNVSHGNNATHVNIFLASEIIILGLFVMCVIYLDYKCRRIRHRRFTVKLTEKGNERGQMDVQLKDSDSEEARKDKIFSLTSMSKYQGVTKRVKFVESFYECDGTTITMTPPHYTQLPPLHSVNSITFVTNLSKKLTNDNIAGILAYGKRCKSLSKIVFQNGILKNCSPVKIPKGFCKTGMQVSDQENGTLLDLEDGIWKSVQNRLSDIKRICAETVCISEAGTRDQHEYIVRLLSRASQNKIPISCLFLNESFNKVDGNDILLSTSTLLPELATVREFRIIKRKRTITEKELVAILRYGQSSKQLTIITLIGVMLPYEITVESIPLKLKERRTKVYVHPTSVKASSYILNLKSGKLTPKNSDEDLSMKRYEQLMEDYDRFWQTRTELKV